MCSGPMTIVKLVVQVNGTRTRMSYLATQESSNENEANLAFGWFCFYIHIRRMEI